MQSGRLRNLYSFGGRKDNKGLHPDDLQMEGKSIVTVEGLSEREKEVYAYAFGAVGAVQCGFCIPGMVMCAKGF